MVHPFQLSNGPTSLHIYDHPPSPRNKSLARPLGQGVLDGIVIVDQVVKIANTGLPAAEMHGTMLTLSEKMKENVFRFEMCSRDIQKAGVSQFQLKCI
jgi:hypothetical protein